MKTFSCNPIFLLSTLIRFVLKYLGLPIGYFCASLLQHIILSQKDEIAQYFLFYCFLPFFVQMER